VAVIQRIKNRSFSYARSGLASLRPTKTVMPATNAMNSSRNYHQRILLFVANAISALIFEAELNFLDSLYIISGISIAHETVSTNYHDSGFAGLHLGKASDVASRKNMELNYESVKSDTIS
jgi:hypothetical protein